MSGFIKVNTKSLLLNNTMKLFFVSFISFVLRAFALLGVVILTNAVLISAEFQFLLSQYNSLFVYFIYSLATVTAYFLLFLFLSAIKTGENAIYFMQSKGTNAKFKYLFIFLKPTHSFRSFCLYFKLFILKLCWGLFFFLPPLFCLILIFYLYFSSIVYSAVFFTLVAGLVFLLSISHFYYKCISIRFSFAVYYICTDLNIGVNEAIEKSIFNSDGFLKDGVYLKTSFLPWGLSCFLLLPAFYVIPFYKLTKAKFITFCDALHKALPQATSVKITENGAT